MLKKHTDCEQYENYIIKKSPIQRGVASVMTTSLSDLLLFKSNRVHCAEIVQEQDEQEIIEQNILKTTEDKSIDQSKQKFEKFKGKIDMVNSTDRLI